jgi:1-deoxy-D-xylulose-5-phosphate reductoisomerase
VKKIVLLGSTGSIGVNTLNVVREHPSEFQVAGLAAGRNVELLAEQIREFKPKLVAIQDASQKAALQKLAGSSCPEILTGEEGVSKLAAMDGADMVVVAITGAAALKPTLAAIAKKRAIGLANKENLVMAGELVMGSAKANGVEVLPIDSEHSAIFQCLKGQSRSEVRKLLLTTSGGPLRLVPLEKFGQLTKAEVMNHPRWKMGPKITVDSATMMNKALELIEARWLFDLPADRVEVIVHPEAIVHSMVDFVDGSVLAQLGITDMRLPIQYAMTYPGRMSCSLPPLDLVALKQLNFEAPKREKFPCLGYGYEAAKAGGTLPAVLNAANETCVENFLADRLPFTQIAPTIRRVMDAHACVTHPNLEQILQADAWARQQAQKLI